MVFLPFVSVFMSVGRFEFTAWFIEERRTFIKLVEVYDGHNLRSFGSFTKRLARGGLKKNVALR